MSLINKIGIGTVQFGLNYGISNKSGQTSIAEVEKILDRAFEVGIRVIDTARMYGESEAVLGENKVARGFKIVSKFMPSTVNRSIREQLQTSCNFLRTASLYAYLAHRPLALLEDNNDWQELISLRGEGKIEKIGFSLNFPHELEQLMQHGHLPDIIQVPYNYFDNRFEPLMIELKKQNCEIHSRSAFLQGLFFADVNELNTSFDEAKERISVLQQTFKKELSSVLLKYVLSKSFIDCVIIGIENVVQLNQNIMGIDDVALIERNIQDFSENILVPSNWK